MDEHETAKTLGRRRFLRSGAVVGSSLILGATGLGRAADGADEIRVAWIGTGTQGQNLLKSSIQIPGVRVAAICDIWKSFHLIRASNWLKLHQPEHRTYTDYRDLLETETDLDAVVIATPDFCHAEQAVAALDRGLHVYCERPMANTVESARRMVEAARKGDKLLQIGHQRRSNPRYRHCGRSLIGEVRILGRITAAYAQWNRPVEPDRGWPRHYVLTEEELERHGYPSMHAFRNWRWYSKLGTGPIGEFGSEQLDVLNWYVGALPRAVLASGGVDYYEEKTHEWPDTVLAVYEYETPKGIVRASYQTISTNSSYGNYEKILGDEGSLMISEAAGRAGVYREPSAPDWDKWVRLEYLEEVAPREPGSSSDDESTSLSITETEERTQYAVPVKLEEPPHLLHLRNFFDAIRGKAPLNCPPSIGYAALATAMKAAEAARTMERLEIDPRELAV